MSIEISKLENGLIVVTDPMPHLESAALGVWVGCGARHESSREAGLSHMLEHMAFKGTQSRSAKDIATQIEAVGGDLNAYTSREQTAFHARVLRDDVDLALDIVSDILINPTFDKDELERERDVIIQEIGQTDDTPDDLIFDYLQEACFPNQPMGWSILGTKDTVANFSRNDLQSYMASNYRAGGMLMIASGAVEHERLADGARALLLRLRQGGAPAFEPARFRGGELRDNRDLEQAHLSFAFPGVATTDADVVTAQVFATALGGGASSRLFQEAREKRGLCYSIYAFSQSHRDSGMIGIYAGTSEEKAGDVAPIIAGEIETMAQSASEEEVARARAQLKATLLMALESPASRCERIAAHLFNFGRVLSIPEMMARLAAVDTAAIRRFAAKLCERGEPAMAAVGPISRLESHDRFARRFGREHALAGA